MVDIQKQVLYWKSGAEEDIAVAEEFIGNKRYRHVLFFAHPALEKFSKRISVKNRTN